MTGDHSAKASNLLSDRWPDVPPAAGLLQLLRSQGVDLCDPRPDRSPPARGTPVYVEASADPSDVMRRMAEAHVRFLFVVSHDRILGLIDMVDLIERAATGMWQQEVSIRPA